MNFQTLFDAHGHRPHNRRESIIVREAYASRVHDVLRSLNKAAITQIRRSEMIKVTVNLL